MRMLWLRGTVWLVAGVATWASGLSSRPSGRPEELVLDVSVRGQRACESDDDSYAMVFAGLAHYQNRGKEELLLESADPFRLQTVAARKAETLRSGLFDIDFRGDIFFFPPPRQFRIKSGHSVEGRATFFVLVARRQLPDPENFLHPGVYFLQVEPPSDLKVRIGSELQPWSPVRSQPIRIRIPDRPALQRMDDCEKWLEER